MEGNAVYNHTGIKGIGFFRKMLQLKTFEPEEVLQNAEDEGRLLMNSIQQARQEWMAAVSNFEQAENEDMIDYYIYKMKACQVRYNYLLKQAKEMGLKHDVYGA